MVVPTPTSRPTAELKRDDDQIERELPSGDTLADEIEKYRGQKTRD